MARVLEKFKTTILLNIYKDPLPK